MHWRVSLPVRFASASSNKDDEQAVVARIRGGDASAFEAMFREYSDGLVRFAERYLRDEGVAEDLVEDVFFRVWELRETWELRSSLRAYLYTATHHRVINYLAKSRVRSRWAARVLPEERERTAPPADDAVHAADFRIALGRAVATLPARCREVFVLHREDGLTYAEIAKLLRLSPKTVEAHVGRALKGLRAALAHYLP
jgi:RNA polymerase sigma-70 factor, ECF subfamily